MCVIGMMGYDIGVLVVGGFAVMEGVGSLVGVLSEPLITLIPVQARDKL